jgi:3-oxoacyl-[acyl-carrier protein] reductase
MDLGIGGKTAVVLGSTQGLGRRIARQLGNEGCRIVVVSRTASKVDDTVRTFRSEGIEAVGHTADIMVKEDVARLFGFVRLNFGATDILVHNNGGPSISSFDEATDEEYIDAYRLLVMSFAWCVKEVREGMRERKWGRIVTVGSMAAKEPHRLAPLVLHDVNRAAALGLNKSLANDLAKFGITVNTIGTGSFDGDEDEAFRRTYRAIAAKKGVPAEELFAARAAQNPTGRLGNPNELAALCAFLCSNHAGFINGQFILIDGGFVPTIF